VAADARANLIHDIMPLRKKMANKRALCKGQRFTEFLPWFTFEDPR
jgi:hypothetical protein